jgi:hypothetical protein
MTRLDLGRLFAALQIQLDAMDRAHLPADSPIRLSWATLVRELHLVTGLRDNVFVNRFQKELERYYTMTPGALGKLYLDEKTREEITNG